MASSSSSSSSSSDYGAMATQTIVNGIEAIGTYNLIKKQNQIIKQQARLAETGAKLSDMQAEISLMNGENQITSMTQGAGQHREMQRTQLAHSGFAIGEGSSAESIASTDIVKQIQMNQMSAAASSQAWGARWDALNQRNQAMMIKANKRNKWLGSLGQFFTAEGQNLLGKSKVNSFAQRRYGVAQPMAKTNGGMYVDAISSGQPRGYESSES